MSATVKTTAKSSTASKGKMSLIKVDCSAPISDQIFDLAAYEKYLRDRIKVSNRTNNLNEAQVTLSRDASTLKISFASLSKAGSKGSSAGAAISKRYVKYLTKKYLKKNGLRDWLRVVSSDSETYIIKYFKVGEKDDDEDDE